MAAQPLIPITYSPAFTLVPTYECFNQCGYCNFRVNPGDSPWLTVEAARLQLETLQGTGVKEILILSGEVHPQSPLRRAWVERLYDLGKLALALGFYPHTNAGPLSWSEMETLKAVNVSMGLMLEQLTPTLLNTVHQNAPSKDPQLRLQQLQQAGALKIPFTTGLLLGIGERPQDILETLTAIAACHEQYSHIQEVILQPQVLGQRQAMPAPPYPLLALIEVIHLARETLPESITLQIPPNLLPVPEDVLPCLHAGVRDLGGIVPIDEVNPDYHHQQVETLRILLARCGYQLTPRLPVYPQYVDWVESIML